MKEGVTPREPCGEGFEATEIPLPDLHVETREVSPVGTGPREHPHRAAVAEQFPHEACAYETGGTGDEHLLHAGPIKLP